MEDEMAVRMKQLGEFIRDQRRVHRLSLRRLSEASGISNPYLSQIERGLRKPSADVLQHIARALGLPAEDFYVRAGILEANDGNLAMHIRRDRDLTDQQKEAMVRLYLQFRGNGQDPHPDGEEQGAAG